MAIPTVVIVGRPNVGKSSLLNRLAKERISIVDPRAGITRDRISTLLEVDNRYFELVDTGGIGIVDDDNLEIHVEDQIAYAIHCADLILLLVDAQQGLTPLDQHVAELLRPLDKSVFCVANKVDEEVHVPLAAEFEKLGFGEPILISAAHGRGRLNLMDRICEHFGENLGESPDIPIMKLAMVGKRNAGKSTLVNTLAGEERVIVSEVPGTTRDSVDVRFEKDGRVFVAIDTAGVRKKRTMDDIDFYSYTRALRSIRRADVVMFLIDSTVPISDVDSKLSRAILDAQRPVVIVINKWDLAKDASTTEAYDEYVGKMLPQLEHAPLVIMTATTGKNTDAAVDLALSLHKQSHMRISTSALNSALEQVLEERGPSAKHGTKPVKIYYATQVATGPPTIVFFCNQPSSVTDNYRRYMENRLRALLPFGEVPLRLLFRSHHRERSEKGEETKG